MIGCKRSPKKVKYVIPFNSRLVVERRMLDLWSAKSDVPCSLRSLYLNDSFVFQSTKIVLSLGPSVNRKRYRKCDKSPRSISPHSRPCPFPAKYKISHFNVRDKHCTSFILGNVFLIETFRVFSAIFLFCYDVSCFQNFCLDLYLSNCF